MSTLVVVGFSQVEEAEQVRREVVDIQREQLLALEDAVVVEHDGDGQVHLRLPDIEPARLLPQTEREWKELGRRLDQSPQQVAREQQIAGEEPLRPRSRRRQIGTICLQFKNASGLTSLISHHTST